MFDAHNRGLIRQFNEEVSKRTFVIRSTGSEPIQEEGADPHKTS